VTHPRFQFRLERVRALREQLEDMSKEELAQSLGHRLRVEAELQSALDDVDGAHRAQLHAVGSEGVSGQDLVAAQAYLERTNRKRDLAAEHLKQREAEVSERREALAAAARERQTLERLKDRKRAEHTLEARRAESVALDELAITRHRRKVA
jgi:flagellar protein FliJ